MQPLVLLGDDDFCDFEKAIGAREARHGQMCIRDRSAFKPFEIGDHGSANLWPDAIEVAFPAPAGERRALRGGLGGGAEVVDDGSGCVEGMTIVGKRAAVPGFPGPDRLLELAEVVISKENERLRGLDQHASRDLRGHAGAGARRVPERLGTGDEAGEILSLIHI